jgi:L-2,4-diaminobutyrate decarboxylase
MERIQTIRKLFISSDEQVSQITGLLEQALEQLKQQHHGTMVGQKQNTDYRTLFRSSNFPSQIREEAETLEAILKLYQGVGLWGHPRMQSNVIPQPTRISIVTEAITACYNENSIWDHYGMSAARSEVMAVGMLADLIGFDKTKAGGIFTFGGTGCNLYASRIGIEKADPDAKFTGIRDRIVFFCSDVSHYSIKSSAIWTGIGLNNICVIPTDDDNMMRVDRLEEELVKTIESGARIGCIFATMGTTDAFGIDPLEDIVALRDKIAATVDYPIHIHADAVIGWPYLTFKDDVSLNGLSDKLQHSIRYIVSRMTELQHADSVGVDFHKTGWGPYLCSAFIVKNNDDFGLLEKFKNDMPYLYHGDGYQPGTFTLESSRPNYAQKALANMMVLGKAGYESLILYLLSMADYLRSQIEASPDIAVLNRNNPAFVTDLRFYPHSKFDEYGMLWHERELHDEVPENFSETINQYNRAIAELVLRQAEIDGTPVISYTDSYKTTRKKHDLVGIKSYPMSPFTEKSDMDAVLAQLYLAKDIVDARGPFGRTF